MTKSNKLRELLRQNKSSPTRPKDLLSTGSTLLNLLCSGRYTGGVKKGIYVHVPGDSDSGKSFLVVTMLAEAANNPEFDGHDLVVDLPEGGLLMDVVGLFGGKLASRIEACRGTMEEPVWSTTVEEFFDWVDDRLKADKPFVAVLDSFDAISSETEEKEQAKARKGREQGDGEGGTYGTARAKAAASRFRKINQGLAATGSILFIVSQAKDKIGFGTMPGERTYAGGKSLKFFAKLQLWTYVKGAIKKTVKGKPRRVGTLCKVRVTKNHLTGGQGEVLVPIYNTYGVDDLGSCIDYLLAEGHWKKNGSSVVAPEFDFSGPAEKLIQQIEENDQERVLRKIVAGVFNEIQEACRIKRKGRYS